VLRRSQIVRWVCCDEARRLMLGCLDAWMLGCLDGWMVDYILLVADSLCLSFLYVFLCCLDAGALGGCVCCDDRRLYVGCAVMKRGV
jgi:hypothetical protein